MSSFIGTNEQLCNSLRHMAGRKTSGETDKAVCNAAADRIEELEAKLAKAVGCLVRLYYGAEVVTDDMHATLAELKGQDDE